ncbi:hypothetical protein FRB96_005931 [Tulasnella sp. 330]|nr:hypothetical protein FRB96_005931 [Tulasnella sp. 330]
MIAVITPFTGRTVYQLHDQKTLEKIERLANTLTTVANDLRMLKADLSFRQISTAVKTVLTYQDVQKRISDCSSKLDWAMSIFQASKSNHCDGLKVLTLYNQIESLVQSDIDQVQRHLELRKDMREVAVISMLSLVLHTMSLPEDRYLS